MAVAREKPIIREGALGVVTGAASGIGRALAEALAERGVRLVLADIAVEPLEEIAHALGATAAVADVTDPVAMSRLAEAAPDATVVCLNAGITSSHPGPVWEAAPEEWDRLMSVNVGGVVNGLRSFVPPLLARGQPARVLITASLAGLATWPGGGPYAASKHAVVAVAEQAQLALAESAVSVSVLCPALVRTAMSPIGEEPRDVAEIALRAMEEGAFVVMPDEWRAAVELRGRRLAGGGQPEFPAMDDLPRPAT